MKIEKITTDVLIIGSGGSGLRAAIEAIRQNVDVLIIAKEELKEAHTGMAMGGLNVAIKAPATPQQHFEDTINGGWFINNYKLARIFTSEMPDRIHDLESYGVKFDRLPDGSYYTWAGGKHSAPLNLCAGDYTGREMMDGLLAEIKRLNVPKLENHFVTKLLKAGKRVVGAFLIDMKTGKYKVVNAKATIVATGGAGQMYKVNTNANSNTGEGYAWGLDAGAKLVDMEMVQFHPTGMAWPPEKKGMLITEKVRGHGGMLKNKLGERFMTKYQPKRLELAGRDEVTRAIYQEIAEGRSTEHGGVHLDITHWKKGDAERLIPDVFAEHMEVGIDIRKQLMEITPSMHHMMGGFAINEWGETNVERLYAVGEVTRSVHGANRLGGNSLGEGQVFGKRAGIRTSTFAKKHAINETPQKAIDEEMKRLQTLMERTNGTDPDAIHEKIKNIMWENVGIIRNEMKLKKALTEIRKLQKEAEHLQAKNKEELIKCVEIQEMLQTAEAVIFPALERKESRGAHYRSDYPQLDKKWERNIIVYKDTNGNLKTKIVPVVKE